MKLAKIISNLITQVGLRYAKLYRCKVDELGVEPIYVYVIGRAIELKIISANHGHKLFKSLIESVNECRD